MLKITAAAHPDGRANPGLPPHEIECVVKSSISANLARVVDLALQDASDGGLDPLTEPFCVVVTVR